MICPIFCLKWCDLMNSHNISLFLCIIYCMLSLAGTHRKFDKQIF